MVEKAVNQVVGEILMSRIAGEIILSDSPGSVMKKWRQLFELNQSELAKYMNVSSSVLSDYENNRRKSPGAAFIKKFVLALINADMQRGGIHVKRYSMLHRDLSIAVIDMNEFKTPRSIKKIVETLDGVLLVGRERDDELIYGYTVVDSLSAIKNLEASDLLYLFGKNPTRVIVFTKVSRGRSPMVAIRLYPIKPKMIVIHGPKLPEEVDSFAIELAELEGIPFCLSLLKSTEEIVENLRKLI
ncbi:MAG: helix-turn-helix domain-containing protein [Aigarchaeota archaeon]|nr:helix-turn-helix domain-containing protein [Aigarchaeota archaeon]MCX8192294.1 helix-turn-helix domain-containing protein [Nitrososphaeria archaeon]MDW7986098.1 helix-turn-helix domain-containing protein [Nitrososphaerota archaeon]